MASTGTSEGRRGSTNTTVTGLHPLTVFDEIADLGYTNTLPDLDASRETG
ncbi:hypothetical protein XA26_48300 [Mycolicibacterium fortuitum]|uniref:Uncharacterized protein n=1 Tax=Mycolicibacterium fortuitum TaxID=1766 RepID=A0A0N9YKF1_MYCFO|nr:hypothetical protein G155_00219 [Mycobacterium sp. VKM Ac-1817D]ALI28629.1 hypothetical protein XA26_48300 [Mycolicibacterium fortuitum]